MLSGISGSLIAGAFLEKTLAPELAAIPALGSAVRALHRWSRRVQRTIGPASGVRLIADVAAMPLFATLGYEVTRLEPHRADLIGTLTREGTTVVLCVSADDRPLDTAWRDLVRAGRVTHARWAIVFTARALRVVDARRSWARRTLDFDLTTVVNDERSARVFAALLQAAGVADHKPGALERIVHRSESHGLDVCTALGGGVIEALTALAAALDTATPLRSRATASNRLVFEQAITLVYRLLFLLFAEARAMVPTWHRIYRDSYSIDTLVQRLMCERTSRGTWSALQAISRLAYDGCHAGDLVVTPFNGRLFSPRHAPMADRVRLPDETAASVLTALATTRGPRGRERVAYADLDVEQLGAVYEHVLEFEPARVNGTLRLTRTSHERKATGSFYTPRAMTDFLVRRALSPLVANKSADEILRLRVLDPAMGSGAFLVSACRYLASALERARIDEGAYRSDPSPTERANLRRMVAQRCLFGVDLNPRAVQLARLSLWLCTLSHDRPLTFLDHHLASGNSLLGAWYSSLPRPPRAESTRRSRATAAQQPLDLQAAGYLSQTLLPERLRITLAAEDSPAAVREKERALATLTAPGTPLTRWKRAADLWCAAWFWEREGLSPGVYADVLAALLGGHRSLSGDIAESVLTRVSAIADVHQLFHWELEFPEVFFDPDGRRDPAGGFDAVIGNPPWDVLRADAGDQAARRESRVSHAAQLRFVRESGVYRHNGRGHANRYQLFIERALQLARPGARLALIVPSGLATDHGSSNLRRHLLDTISVDRVLGFDNRRGIFQIHRDMKFLLLTGTTGSATERLTGAFGCSNPEWLDHLPDSAADDPPAARVVALSRTLIDRLDPEHLSLPLLHKSEDLDVLTTAVANVPRLGAPDGWHVAFGRELNATDDSAHFVAAGADGNLIPIIEGKHLEPFRALVSASRRAIAADKAVTLIDPDRTFRRTRLAYRDVASASNRVTLIAALLPAGTVSTHTLFCAKTPLAPDAQYCLLALLNSLVANYLVRLQVTTHVTTALMSRLPVPHPDASSEEFHELARLALALEQTGISAGESEYARLNAVAARMYGLSLAQYAHVVSTFRLLSQQLRDLCVHAFGSAEPRTTSSGLRPMGAARRKAWR